MLQTVQADMLQEILLGDSAVRHVYWVDAPVSAVIACHRDDLSDFAASLPGVSRIDPVEHSIDGERQHMLHCWHGDPDVLPAFIAARLAPEHFVWEDDSEWVGDQVSWQITAKALGAGPHLVGSHCFRAVGDRTEVTVEAELAFVDHITLWGMPLGRVFRGMATGFIEFMFSRVASETGAAVEAHLEATGARLRRAS